jgi:hypothetical protein
VYVRVSVEDGGPGFDLAAGVDPATDLADESFGFKITVPRHDCAALAGYVIDYRSVGPEPGFVLKDPRSLHSRASDPGHLLLFAGEPGFFRWLLGRRPDPGLQEFREGLAEHLRIGDSRAAVDELDCVALLRFPDHPAAECRLGVGSRLLTVNMYRRDHGGRPRISATTGSPSGTTRCA